MKKKPLTQLDKLLRYLQTHAGITGLQALKVCGTMYLPRRICDLEERGYKFERRWICKEYADGRKIRFIQYRLVK